MDAAVCPSDTPSAETVCALASGAPGSTTAPDTDRPSREGLHHLLPGGRVRRLLGSAVVGHEVLRHLRVTQRSSRAGWAQFDTRQLLWRVRPRQALPGESAVHSPGRDRCRRSVDRRDELAGAGPSWLEERDRGRQAGHGCGASEDRRCIPHPGAESVVDRCGTRRSDLSRWGSRTSPLGAHSTVMQGNYVESWMLEELAAQIRLSRTPLTVRFRRAWSPCSACSLSGRPSSHLSDSRWCR